MMVGDLVQEKVRPEVRGVGIVIRVAPHIVETIVTVIDVEYDDGSICTYFGNEHIEHAPVEHFWTRD